MAETRVQIPTKVWYGDTETTLSFPEEWDVQECRMAGHDSPPLSDDEIRRALEDTYDSSSLSELARGKHQVVILFDDLTRPAPTSRILPFVLETLSDAGIPDDHIRFVGAYANHAAMSREDFAKKLGEDVMRRFRVYNHNPYEHHVDLGTTSRGTPILVNREVMSCDMKIGIGGLIPHMGAGFGGGAKMVFPGVMSIESVAHNHGQVRPQPRNTQTGMLGIVDGNVLREDIEEAVSKVGLDMKIDLLINNRRELVGVFAGHFIAQHRAGVARAREQYATACPENMDIVVCNTYPIENQATKGVWPARLSLKAGGTAVVVTQSIEGQALHYLTGRFGTDYGGKLWNPTKAGVANASKVVVYSEYLSRTDLDRFGPADRVVGYATWEQVIRELRSDYPKDARVAVFPCAAIQCPDNLDS
ncbi:MAG: hypothetical protein CME19_02215 [Gemmatimonadetes bacterium]|nr:hypothetical protein [Gemmatimonadota bacterium]